MTIADKIITALRQHSGLSAVEIAVNIFGRRHPYTQRINHACRRLVDAGRLERRGKGGPGDPFTYYLPSVALADPKVKNPKAPAVTREAEEDWR